MANNFQDGDNINVLIKSSSALGTGLTLTRAQFTIIVGRESDPGIHAQVKGRMVRQTDRNWAGLVIYELYCEEASRRMSDEHGRKMAGD